MQAYDQLKSEFKKISSIEHAQSILGWDEAAMMPHGGGDSRAESLATLNGIIHELKSSTKIRSLLDKVDDGKLDAKDQANFRQMRRAIEKANALPNDFVHRRSLAATKSEQRWRSLRGQNDWNTYRPILEELFVLVREEAGYYAQQSGLSPYDALLDLYEPEVKASDIEPIFTELRNFIPGLLKKVLAKQGNASSANGSVSYDQESQKQLGLKFMKSIGFDFNHGRLDTSTHPFCGGVPDDVRITTRYATDNFLSALMGVLHETGHAMYEQGLPGEWRGQPLGNSAGMMIHESQSLFWEMQICRSQAFYKFAGPTIRETFPKQAQQVDLSDDGLYRFATKVKPGYIRVDADEVCYPLHIILRFEIEQDLFAGRIAIKDLPEVWDAKMTSYLGLSTKGNFKDGCMQDVHWPAGMFGYFPCYSLGAITAAQLFNKVKSQIEDPAKLIGVGNFTPILEWLRKNVHSQGRMLNAKELIKSATGEALSAKYFMKHLETRYLA